MHLRDFGLNSFTSGSVRIAPNRSTEILRALKAGDDATAETIRAGFLPFEGRRDAISPIRVLHDGVTLAGIADNGYLFCSTRCWAPVARRPRQLRRCPMREILINTGENE